MASVHDDEIVSESLRLVEFVRGDEQRTPAIAFGANYFANYLATFGVNRRGWFVKHQHSRSTEEGEGQQRALLLATAQPSPRGTRAPIEVEQRQKFRGAAGCLVVSRGEFEYLGGGHGEPHAAALQQGPGARDHFGVVAHRIKSVETDGATGRRAKTQQRLDYRGLARPVGAEQARNLPVRDVKRDVVNGVQIAKGDSQVLDLDSVTHDI